MATRSVIAKRIRYRGKLAYKAIYCHWDGYPHKPGVGWILRTYYKSPERVDKLLSLGNISYLEKEIGRKHSFDSPHPGWTVAYYRDRKESWNDVKPRIFTDLYLLKKWANSAGAEYLYVYENGKWRTINLG